MGDDIKQPFNLRMPADLIKSAKLRALETDRTASNYIADLIRADLARVAGGGDGRPEWSEDPELRAEAARIAAEVRAAAGPIEGDTGDDA